MLPKQKFLSPISVSIILLGLILVSPASTVAKGKPAEDRGAKQLCSTLGGKEKHFRLDIDPYTFEGQKGEKVIVTLSADPSGSHTGDQATLILTSRFKCFFKIDRSPLPNKISTVLPASGEYFVYVIEQLKHKHFRSFRGSYCLGFESSRGAWRSFRPFEPPYWHKHPITWIPEAIEETISKGTSKELDVAFISRIDLEKVNLWVTPELRPFIRIEPDHFEKIEDNIPNQVILHLTVPADAKPGHYDGTIHLRVGHRTYPGTLKVDLNIIENIPPIADAGPDQVIALPEGQTTMDVQLDGSGSHDPDGTIASYTWTGTPDPEDVEKPIVSLSSGTYSFSLVVKDNEGAMSAPDVVSITVAEQQMSFAQERFAYYSGGNQINLEIFRKQLSMRVAEGQMENLRQWLEENNFISHPLEIEKLGRKNIILVTLIEEITPDQILELILDLNQTNFVVYSTPVFGNENEKVLITDQFVARFRDSLSVEEIESFILSKKVTIIKKDFLWPKCYLLGFTAASGANTLEIAREFYESGMVLYAHPDFIVMTQRPWVPIVEESFEGEFPKSGWQVYDANPEDGQYYWGKVSKQLYYSLIDQYTAGNWKLWVSAGHAPPSPDLSPTDNRVENYAPNMDSWMIFGPFDLSEPYWYRLKYKIEKDIPNFQEKVNNEAFPFDILMSQDGSTWYERVGGGNQPESCRFVYGYWNLQTIRDYQGNYRYVSEGILYPWGDCDLETKKNIWFAFRFRSDSESNETYNNMFGVFIDDIEILASNTEPAQLITNDPLSPMQWALKNKGQSGGIPNYDINIVPAWDFLRNERIMNPSDFSQSDIIVAVLDEGVDLNHEDLNLVPGYDATYDPSDPKLIDRQGGPNPWDGHGTACAGIIGAKNNNLGVVGVAPGIRIMPVRIAFSEKGSGFWTFSYAQSADGILWAVNHGARVLSNSWGGGPDNDLLHDAIREAKSKGAVIIFAAGNHSGPHPLYPARYDETIAVGAMSPCGERKSGFPLDLSLSCDMEVWGSNYGPELDVIAPGVLITTTDIMGPDGYGRGNYIDFFNGTSSAAPHVAGVVALILTRNPRLNPDSVREIIRISARDIGEIGRDDLTGYGLVNAYMALVHAGLTILPYTVHMPFYNGIQAFHIYGGNKPYLYEWAKCYKIWIGQPPSQREVCFVDSSLPENFDVYYGESSVLLEVNGYIPSDLTKLWLKVTDSSLPSVSVTREVNILRPDISVIPLNIDFGDVEVGWTTNREITVTNSGNFELQISSVSITGSADIRHNNNCPQSLAPQATCTILAIFNPTNEGPATATLTITSNDPDEGTKNIALTGNGTIPLVPDMRLQGGNLSFLTVVGTSESQDIMVWNAGRADLVIDRVYISGPSEFAITANTCTRPITPWTNYSHDSCTITVTFTPSITGPVYGNIYIESNDPDTPLHTGSLSGFGIAPYISVTPVTMDFGSTSITDTLTIQNTSSSQTLSWSIINNLPSWLSVSQMAGEIDPGASTLLTVTVDRTGLQPGTYLGDIYITSDGGERGVAVRMSVPSFISITPASIDFAEAKKRLPLTISNTNSSTPLTWSITADLPAWLTASQMSGVTPAGGSTTVYLYPNRSGLYQDQTYTHTLSITSNGGNVTLPVSMTVPIPLATFAKYYGGDDGEYFSKIRQTSDGGFIAVGLTNSFGAGPIGTTDDAWVVKLDSSGYVEWERTYGGYWYFERAYDIRQTSDGGFIMVAGTYTFTSDNSYGLWILKLDSYGDIEWQKEYGGNVNNNWGDWGMEFTIQQTIDGGYIVAGNSSVNDPDERSDIWVLKLDSDGDVQWQKTYGNFYNGHSREDYANSIQQTSDGGYIVAGVSRNVHGENNADLWILKLDSSGNIAWQKIYGTTDWDHTYDIQQTSDGGYIVAGTTWSTSSAWVLKLYALGDIEWQKTYGGYGSEYYGSYGHSVKQTSDGGYILTGVLSSRVTGDDIWVVKLNSSGDIEWQRTYGGDRIDVAYSIEQTLEGDYIVTGYTNSFRAKPSGSPNYDAFVMKIDSIGNIGASCGIMDLTSVTPVDTNIIPVDTSVIPQDSTTTARDTNATVIDSSAVTEALCTETIPGAGQRPLIDIDVSPMSYNFDDYYYLFIGDTASQVFAVENKGYQPLGITNISLSGSMDFTATHNCPVYPDNLLDIAQACEITVSFTPSGEGAQGAYLRIESNDPDEGLIEIQITGSGWIPGGGEEGPEGGGEEPGGGEPPGGSTPIGGG